MPAERFYHSEARTSNDERQFAVQWGHDPEAIDLPVNVAGIPMERSGLNRLIRTLKKARDQSFGADE